MEVGLQNKTIVGFIIQARMRSTRLPGKVLMPIPLNGGKPIIQWIVDEVKKSKFAKEIVLATSTDAENDPLFHYCRERGINCFRGDEDDVLSRFIKITSMNDFDVVVRLTGDNPIVDIQILDAVIDFHIQSNNDYSWTEGLPTGMNLEVVSPAALLALRTQVLAPAHKEHVTLFIRDNDIFKKAAFKVNVTTSLAHSRLTVDYPSDFLVLNTVLSLLRFSKSSGISGLEDLIATYPWVFDVNVSNIQKSEYPNFESECKAAAAILNRLGMKRAASCLSDL